MSNQKRNRVEQIIIENNVDTSKMYHKERKIAFINDYFENSKDSDITIYVQKFNQYGKIENEINKDLLEFVRSDWFYFFESFPWAYSSFNSNKGNVKAYLDWGRDQHLTDSKVSQELERITYDEPSHKKMFETYYFKSLNELTEKLNEFEKDIEGNVKILRFTISEIAIFLAWAGIKIQDACAIQKQDINDQDKSIFIKSRNKYVQLDSVIYDAISEYRYSTDYIDSFYLLRAPITLRKNPTNIISVNYIANSMSLFFGENESNKEQDKIINYNRVYWSGIYSRAVEKYGYKDLDGLDMKILSELFQEDYEKLVNPQPTISKRLIEYRDYLTYMYGSEYLKG